LNLRPLGYEPSELPNCSTPRRSASIAGTAVAPAGFEPASSGLKGRWHGPLAHGAIDEEPGARSASLS
jgi:hypothetical protein